MKALVSRFPRLSLPSGWMPIMSDRIVWAFLSGIVLVALLDPNQLGPSIDFMREALMGMALFFGKSDDGLYPAGVDHPTGGWR